MNINKRLFFLIRIVLILSTAVFVIFLIVKNVPKNLKTKAYSVEPELLLIPKTVKTNIGNSIYFNIIINTNEKTVSAAEIHLSYDKEAIEIVKFTPGGIFPVILTPENHNEGELTVVLGVQPASPFKGSGIVGILEAKVKKNKSSRIDFTNQTKITSLGEGTNSLGAANGSLINIIDIIR